MTNETERRDRHSRTSRTGPTRMSRGDQATLYAEVRRLAGEGHRRGRMEPVTLTRRKRAAAPVLQSAAAVNAVFRTSWRWEGR